MLYERDRSRKWITPGTPSNEGRPVRISVWYPAIAEESGQQMHYGDYFHHDAPPNVAAINAALDKSDRESWLDDLKEISTTSSELFATLNATPVAALRDAPAAHGSFPIVLYAGGLGSRADANVELGEFLASHGYVLVTVPQLGPSPDNLQLSGLEDEVQLINGDFDFALQRLRALPNVDTRHVAVIGHSVGGIVALVFAMRHPEVRAMVGLDASYGFAGALERIRRLAGYDPNKLRASVLDLRRANGVQSAKVDVAALEELKNSDRYLITFQRTFHGDFTEFGTIGLKLSVPLPKNDDGRTRETGFEGNQHAYRAVLDFLEGIMRGEKRQFRELKSEIDDFAGATFRFDKRGAN